MSTYRQILEYARMRAELSAAEDGERGEVSTTTIIWAAALVLVAVAVSAALVQKIQAKAAAPHAVPMNNGGTTSWAQNSKRQPRWEAYAIEHVASHPWLLPAPPFSRRSP